MGLTIARSMTLFGILVCVGLLSIMGLSTLALSQVKVTGSLYSRIVEGKDLVGDILPPPEYVIEAYLEANLAQGAPANVAVHKARLAQLHKDYNDRLDYWKASALPPEIKLLLSEASDAQVQPFWRELEGTFIPAVERNDIAAANSSMAVLTRYYEAHRKVIDQIVVKANALCDRNEAEARTKVRDFSALLFGGALGCLVVVIGGFAALRRRVVSPIRRMTDYMSALAGGDYENQVPYVGRADEIGEMAASVAVFRTAVLERRRAREEQEIQRLSVEAERSATLESLRIADADRSKAISRLAEGLTSLSAQDLMGDIGEAFPEQYDTLRRDFNAALSALRSTVNAIVTSAEVVHVGAEGIAQATDNLSRRTEQQAAALEETAASLDQITSTVRQTSAAADECQSVVANTKSRAEQSEQVVDAALSAMNGIEASSNQIGQIIGVIDEIAFQTNLLALNAGVEAARAGESGRGFAVVAQEVRALAQRSAEAAKQIKGLISASSGQVKNGVGLVGETAQALREIVLQVGRINDLVGGIAASARDQATSLREINQAVTEMDQVTQQNAAMVEETTASSHELSDEAGELGRLVGGFNTGAASAGSRAKNPARRAA